MTAVATCCSQLIVAWSCLPNKVVRCTHVSCSSSICAPGWKVWTWCARLFYATDAHLASGLRCGQTFWFAVPDEQQHWWLPESEWCCAVASRQRRYCSNRFGSGSNFALDGESHPAWKTDEPSSAVLGQRSWSSQVSWCHWQVSVEDKTEITDLVLRLYRIIISHRRRDAHADHVWLPGIMVKMLHTESLRLHAVESQVTRRVSQVTHRVSQVTLRVSQVTTRNYSQVLLTSERPKRIVLRLIWNQLIKQSKTAFELHIRTRCLSAFDKLLLHGN